MDITFQYFELIPSVSKIIGHYSISKGYKKIVVSDPDDLRSPCQSPGYDQVF